MRLLILALALVLQLGAPLARAWPVMSNFAGGSTATPCTASTATFAVACDAALIVGLGVVR